MERSVAAWETGREMAYAFMALAAFLAVTLALGSARSGAAGSAYAIGTNPTHQYDGGTTHAYGIDANTMPININISGAIYGTPTIYRGVMYVTAMGDLKDLQDSRYDLTDGSVSAIDMSTGGLVWRVEFPNQIMTQPIVAGNLLVVGISNNGEVPSQYYNLFGGMAGIDIATGSVAWFVHDNQTKVVGSELATPAYYNGLIIEPGIDKAVIYNASTGAVVNSIETNLPDVLSSPLLVKDTAYFGAGYANAYGFNSFEENLSGVRMNITSDERFFAVNVIDGSVLWATRFVNAGTGLNDVSAAFANGTIVTAYLYQSDYTNPTVAALNSTTGRILWEINETKYIEEHGLTAPPSANRIGLNYTQNTISPITIWKGVAYLDSNFIGFLFAVNISRGEVLWATPTGQDEGNPNVFYDNYLITVNDGGMLYVINASDGSIVNETFIGMPHLASEPIITNNYAILSGMDGRIISLPLDALIKPHLVQ